MGSASVAAAKGTTACRNRSVSSPATGLYRHRCFFNFLFSDMLAAWVDCLSSDATVSFSVPFPNDLLFTSSTWHDAVNPK